MQHLLAAADLSRDEATLVLDTAEEMARLTDRAIKKLPTLRGRTVVNLFFEDSTRTRLSFETAAKRLSADTMTFAVSQSSLNKGESLRDTIETIAAMGIDAFVIRHGSSGTPWQVSQWTDASIVNAGDGAHEHPTQALLDAFTIRRRKGRLAALKVTVVGDIEHSRVVRSNIHLLEKLEPPQERDQPHAPGRDQDHQLRVGGLRMDRRLDSREIPGRISVVQVAAR